MLVGFVRLVFWGLGRFLRQLAQKTRTSILLYFLVPSCVAKQGPGHRAVMLAKLIKLAFVFSIDVMKSRRQHVI